MKCNRFVTCFLAFAPQKLFPVSQEVFVANKVEVSHQRAVCPNLSCNSTTVLTSNEHIIKYLRTTKDLGCGICNKSLVCPRFVVLVTKQLMHV